MSDWLRRVLFPYMATAVPIYLVATQPVRAETKLAVAYSLLAVFLVALKDKARRPELRPYRRDRPLVLLLTTVGYFLLIMAVRLPIYADVQQIWEKTPMIVLVMSSVLLWERNRPADFGLQARDWQRQAGAGLILFAVTWCGVAFGFLIRELVFSGIPEVGIGSRLAGALFQLLMFGYGNFAEELFFRGYVQTKLRRAAGATAAIALQAVLFALYHVNYRIFPRFDAPGLALYLWFTFTFGVVMGIIAERTRGLVAPTIVHVGYNMTWPGSLLYVGYRSARPFADTLLSAALPWLAFLLFAAPLSACVLRLFGYRRSGARAGSDETARASAV